MCIGVNHRSSKNASDDEVDAVSINGNFGSPLRGRLHHRQQLALAGISRP
jgi:hypothetical protein